MPARRQNGVGRFSVDLEIANYQDLSLAQRGLLAADRVRRETVRGIVDSGAAKLVLPADLVKRLGLPLGTSVQVRYADGRKARRRRAEGVYLELLGRHGTFTAVIEPNRQTALVGAIVLEDLDLLVDCVSQQVMPRDSRGEVFEIE
jgi:hypothetical protein